MKRYILLTGKAASLFISMIKHITRTMPEISMKMKRRMALCQAGG